MGKYLWEYTKEDWERLENEFDEIESRNYDFVIHDDLSLQDGLLHDLWERKEKPKFEHIIDILGEEDSNAYLEILKNYNLNDRLSDYDFICLLVLFQGIRHKDNILEKDLDNICLPTFQKLFAEMILLLRHGKNIKLSADIPKKGKQNIEISNTQTYNLISMLDNCLYNTMHSCYYKGIGYEQKPFDVTSSDNDLKRLINEEEKKENYRIKSIGRENKYLARLGKYICDKLRVYSLFSKLTQTEAYCLIGDFLVYNGQVPSYTWEEWEVKGKPEKKDDVKYWIKAYQNLSK